MHPVTSWMGSCPPQHKSRLWCRLVWHCLVLSYLLRCFPRASRPYNFISGNGPFAVFKGYEHCMDALVTYVWSQLQGLKKGKLWPPRPTALERGLLLRPNSLMAFEAIDHPVCLHKVALNLTRRLPLLWYPAAAFQCLWHKCHDLA